LGKFKNLTPPDDILRTKILEILASKFNVEVNKRDISIKNGIVFFIGRNSSLKSEIFLKKREILEELKSVFGAVAPRDIR